MYHWISLKKIIYLCHEYSDLNTIQIEYNLKLDIWQNNKISKKSYFIIHISSEQRCKEYERNCENVHIKKYVYPCLSISEKSVSWKRKLGVQWRSCEAEELNGRREEVTGCLEMNDFEINFLDTQAAVTGGRGMKLTLSCRGGPWIMEDILSKFLKCTTIAYWLPRKGRYNIYTRLLSTNQLFQHGILEWRFTNFLPAFHAFVFSIRLRRRWIDSLESFGGGKEIDFYRFIWIIWINRILDIFTRDTSLFHSSKHWSKFFNL